MSELGTDFDPERVVFTDKRRIDPASVTKESAISESATEEPNPFVEEPAPLEGVVEEGSHLVEGRAEEPSPEEPAVETAEAPAEPAAEPDYLAALQRVTAEYANYRKRVDRDRMLAGDNARAGLLEGLLPLLDDIDRARQHGDLTGGFKGVGEGLEALVERLGLERFGSVGEPFDPAVHEALMQSDPDPEFDVATCSQVLQQGYRLKTGRVLRPARVAVAEPGLQADSLVVPTEES